MNQVEIVVGLLIVVAALAIAAKRIALPYPVLLVVAGLGLGFVHGPPQLQLDPEMVLLFVLPPLLYPAALFTSWRDFRANLTPILWLAIGLVLVTTFAIGAVAHALGGLPWGAALIGSSFSLGAAGLRFVWVAIGGIGIGLLVGWIASHVQRCLEHPRL